MFLTISSEKSGKFDSVTVMSPAGGYLDTQGVID